MQVRKIVVLGGVFLITLSSLTVVSAVNKNNSKAQAQPQAKSNLELAKLNSIDDPVVAPVVKAKQESSVSPEAQEFIAKITKIKTLTANFVQTEQNSKQPSQLKGRLALIKPNKLLWEISSPEKERQVYVTNGAKFWHYDKSLEQVVVDNFDSKRITSSPLYFLLMNTDSLTKMYEVSKLGEGMFGLKTKPPKSTAKKIVVEEVVEAPALESEVVLESKYKTKPIVKSDAEKAAEEINPDLTDNYATDLKLTFDSKTDKLTKISFTAAKNKTIVVDLTNVQINSSVTPSAFDFKAPKGVDVINASELYE